MKKIFIISLVSISILLIALICVFLFWKDQETKDSIPKDKPEAIEVKKPVEEKEPVNQILSFMTGLPVNEQSKQHFSVMIENTPEARPQTGLYDADLVYEITTEAKITRYLAFYNDNVPDVIGPVRSSRHYFIPLAEEMNFPYIHFGGSNFAYDALKKVSIPHIDGITQGKHFFRDKTRVAPHNAYLKTNTLESFGSLENNLDRFKQSNEVPVSDIKSSDISISFNSFTDVKYQYDEKTKTYLRFQEDKPHIDRVSTKQLYTHNIILQYAPHNSIKGDSSGRIDVNLTGEGKIVYFSNGSVFNGTWIKEADGLTRFYNDQNNLIVLTPGKTWIEIVHEGIKISY